MTKFNFKFIRRKKQHAKRFSLLILKRRNIIHFILLVICNIFYFFAVSQNIIRQNNGTQSEIIEAANINLLPKNRIPLTEKYRAAVIKESGKASIKNLVPFYPYFNINLSVSLLPVPTPFRVYLGKSSTADTNDYNLIIVPCNNNNIKKPLGSTSKYQYTDIEDNGLSIKSSKTSRWYSITVTNISKNSERVTYSPISKALALKYRENFKTSILRLGVDTSSYPTCMILANMKHSRGRMKLQPVIRDKSGRSNDNNGGVKSIYSTKKFFFQGSIYSFEDADGQEGFCCEAPPENGNSMY